MKTTVTLGGGLEALVLELVRARGITEQEAIRCLLGEALDHRSQLQSTPVDSSVPQSTQGPSSSPLSPEVPASSPSLDSPPSPPSYPLLPKPPIVPQTVQEPVQKRRRKVPALPPETYPPHLDSPRFRDLFVEFMAARASTGKAMIESTVKWQLNKLGEWDEPTACSTLEASLAGGWQGTFPEKIPGGRRYSAESAPAEAERVLCRYSEREKVLAAIQAHKPRMPPALYDRLIEAGQGAQTVGDLAAIEAELHA